MPKLGIAFIITNVFVWTFQIIIISLWAAGVTSREKEGSPLYELIILTDVTLSSLMAIGFTVYGFRLLFRKIHLHDARAKEALRVTVLTLIFSLCFMVRVYMFAYRPLTGNLFPISVFYVFGYYFTEGLPTLIQLYLVQTTRIKEERASKFIDDLYAGEDTSTTQEREALLGKRDWESSAI